jgi:hypothetical protein
MRLWRKLKPAKYLSEMNTEIVFVLEGGMVERLPGFRHYQIRKAGRCHNAISLPNAAKNNALRNGWRFYPSGLWEAKEQSDFAAFPSPSREVLMTITKFEQGKMNYAT